MDGREGGVSSKQTMLDRGGVQKGSYARTSLMDDPLGHLWGVRGAHHTFFIQDFYGVSLWYQFQSVKVSLKKIKNSN